MGVSDEADRTLFVGNLDPQVTEELLFELFLQAGPLIKVKIPKDNDGRAKQFAFVNFKHEVSVPYGMELLNGTKLFGRALKIQFRSGSSHMNQEGKNPSPSNTPGRYDRPDQMGSPLFSTPPQMQRSFSSPDSLQRQALMNNMWQLQMHQLQQLNGAFPMGFPPAFGGAAGGVGGGGGGGVAAESPWQLENQSSRGHRYSHQQDSGGGHHGRDQRYSDAGPERHRRDFHHHDDRSGGRNRDYPDRRRDQREGSRDTPRDGRYRRY
ncbi:RNA-binding protein 7 [Alosa sapidissima]|uniref:RNA-binding protein 7 n=1 Tax=Alosa sapidissima TaxID=34773 RepID=UPI001C082AB2|nr:RNA-binding protein 7 [Alosa sapidissima]